MSIPPEIVSQVLSLPVQARFELANQLLDSIDDDAAAKCDEELLAELLRRREEMLRGQEIVSDWRAALSTIERSLSAEQ